MIVLETEYARRTRQLSKFELKLTKLRNKGGREGKLQKNCYLLLILRFLIRSQSHRSLDRFQVLRNFLLTCH
jgi:hypothetical protein